MDGEWCGLKDNFFQAIYKPIDYYFLGYFDSIFWGIIVLMIYMKYRDGLYAGIVGIVIVVSGAVLNSEFTAIGGLLLIVSISVAVVQLFMRKRSG